MQRGLARARTHNLLEYTRKGLKIVQSIVNRPRRVIIFAHPIEIQNM